MWVPRMRALTLADGGDESSEEDEGEKLQNSMKHWQDTIQQCVKNLTALEDKIAQKEK